MHCSNFPVRIYMEKTPEQCNFSYHHSRQTKADIWCDMYSSECLDEEQVYGEDEEEEVKFTVALRTILAFQTIIYLLGHQFIQVLSVFLY